MNTSGIDSSGSGRVLVADDEPTTRTVLETLMKDNGYLPTTASDGQEAVDHASSMEFEVALLDIGMPGMSGLKVLEWLQKNAPDTVVIMVTAMTGVDTAVEAMKLGAYDYIVKPFNVDDVLAKTRRAREQRSLRIQVRQHKQELEQKVIETQNRLREQFEQLVLSLAREHTMAIEIETLRQAKREKALFSSLPKELQQPKASVEEFVQALIGMIKSEGVG